MYALLESEHVQSTIVFTLKPSVTYNTACNRFSQFLFLSIQLIRSRGSSVGVNFHQV